VVVVTKDSDLYEGLDKIPTVEEANGSRWVYNRLIERERRSSGVLVARPSITGQVQTGLQPVHRQWPSAQKAGCCIWGRQIHAGERGSLPCLHKVTQCARMLDPRERGPAGV
jgi:hypothetical protein